MGFPKKKLGLDANLASWDLKIRIPRRKLRIWSYFQVETRRYRSKYLKIYCLIGFSHILCFLIGSLGYLLVFCHMFNRSETYGKNTCENKSYEQKPSSNP